MPARRTLAAALSGVACLLPLTACEKPSAGVSLTAGREHVHAEGSQYCRDAAVLVTGTECPGTGPAVTLIKVAQGERVQVDVDKALRERGWLLYDADARQKSSVKKTSHTSLVADFAGRPLPGIINLEVRTVDHVPSSDTDLPRITGIWTFQLVQQD